MIFWYLLVMTLGLSTSQTLANPNSSAAAMSLETVYLLAVEQAPSLAIARYRMDSAEAQSADARGSLLPQVSLFGEWSENKLSYDGALSPIYGEENYPGQRYGFQARQALFNMSRFREVQRRNALFDRSKSDLAQAKIELLAQVVDAYLTVLVADNTVSQFQVESEALEKQLDEAQALYSRALMPVTQVLETQTRSETVRADLIEAEGEAAIARERLTELIGMRDFELMDIARGVSLAAHMATPSKPSQTRCETAQPSPLLETVRQQQSSLLSVKREVGGPRSAWF